MIFIKNSINLSWNLIRFIGMLRIIQISEQYANCQLLLRYVLWYSWLIFWTIFKSWSSKLHLWVISIYLIILHIYDYWVGPPNIYMQYIVRSCEKVDFLLLAFTYLFWNDVKTVKASFLILLNTRFVFAPQTKG